MFSSARDAVAAAIDMQRSFASECGEGFVRVRMGLHTGEAARTATGLVGLDVHRTARIASAAHGGQVVLSEVTATLARHTMPEGAGLKDLGRHRLKDLGDPEQIFQLESPGLDVGFPPLRSLENPALPNNLPAQLATFVGRTREVPEVRALVATNRLVTLTGPGGSGKTRLALQVAAEMLDGAGDGVWLVELATLDDEGAVPDAIANALGLSLGAGSALEGLAAALAPQRALVILDNCEHLIGGCAKVADALLRRGTEVHLLATSREPLGLAGEAIYRVPSLTLPDAGDGTSDYEASDAVALLVDRARSQGVELGLDESSLPLIASVCRRLDGMPLAIELAAARLRSLSLEALEQRLDQRFQLLTGGSRGAPARQQTLRSAIDWSFSLLAPDERTLLDRLSVFVGGFDLDAAEKVCGFGALKDFELADLLGSLVDKSLVVAERRGSSVRYRMLETIRDFARADLVERDETDVDRTAEAHVRYFLAFAEAARLGFDGRGQAAWLERFELEEPNVARAIELAATRPDSVETLLRFARALRRAWTLVRPRARQIMRSGVESPQADDHPFDLAHALISWCCNARGNDAELALPLSRRALALARTLDDERLLLDALFGLATTAYFAGRAQEGATAGTEGVERARALGDPMMLAASLMAFLLCADELDPSSTEHLFTEAINAAILAGDGEIESTLHNNAAVHELRRGNLSAARAHLEAEVDLAESMSSGRRRQHYALVNLGWVLWQQAELDRARSLFVEALRITRRNGDLSGVSYATLGIACLLTEDARWADAAEVLGAAQAARELAGGQWETPEDHYCEECAARVQSALGQAASDESLLRGASRMDALVAEVSRGWPRRWEPSEPVRRDDL